MLTPARLTELMVEVVFLLLGALVVWLAAQQRIYFDRHNITWLVLSFALIVWGAMALARPGQFWARWQKWNRGLSLILLGLVMLAISRASLEWVVRLILVGGLILFVRGALGSILILRRR